MQKREIITQAAMQNLPTDNPAWVQRLTPLIVTEAIIRTNEYGTGRAIPRVDMWNNVGLRIDRECIGEERRTVMSDRLNEKYCVLNQLGIVPKDRQVLTDDQPETLAWLEEKVIELYEKRVFFRTTVEMSVCGECGYEQTPAEIVLRCNKCGQSIFRREFRQELVAEIPEDRQGLYQGKILLPDNYGELRGGILNFTTHCYLI